MNFKFYFITFLVLVLALAGGGGYVYYQTHKAQPVTNEDITVFLDTSNKGDTDGAIVLAQKNAARDPKDVTSLLDLAFAYLDKGSLDMMENQYADKALETVNQVLALDPNNSEAYRAMGYAYEIKQQYDKAIPSYTKAIALDANNDLAYANRGHAYDLMGQLDLAKKDYDAAYTISPGRDFTLINLARYSYRNDDASNTIAYALGVIKNSKKARMISSANELIGLSYTNLQDYASASSAFGAAISADPKNAGPYLDRAYMNYVSFTAEDGVLTPGEVQTIQQDLDRALTIDSNLANAYVVKAMVFDTLKDTASMNEAIKKELSVIDADITLTADQKESMKADALASLNS